MSVLVNLVVITLLASIAIAFTALGTDFSFGFLVSTVFWNIVFRLHTGRWF